MKLTPDMAIEARKSLKLSQSRVANDTGINRAYLSQFESSTRVLEGDKLSSLMDYFSGLGWQPAPEQAVAEPEQLINSDKHGLTIVDGFVIADGISQPLAEDLLDEYYENDQEITGLTGSPVKRGFFGGLDGEGIAKQALRPLIIMARQCEIQKILQGQFDLEGNELKADIENPDGIETVGDYIEALKKCAIPERLLPEQESEQVA